MANSLHCIMLIDDDEDDNFLHERVIKKSGINVQLVVSNSGQEALEYLKSMESTKAIHPDLIFLDINMHGLNGWEFLKEYNKLDKRTRGAAVIIMLSTSKDEIDKAKAKEWSFVYDYITKPLSEDILMAIVKKYFS